MRTRTPNPAQNELSFFDVPSTPRPEVGGQDIALAVREALTDLLAGAAARGLDRYQLAAEVSRRGNHEISKNMLDRYCAHSADGWRFPLEALPALTVATGDFRLLELVAEASGCRVVRGEEALLAEIGALTLQKRSVDQRLTDLRRNVPDAVLGRLLEEVMKRVGGGR